MGRKFIIKPIWKNRNYNPTIQFSGCALIMHFLHAEQPIKLRTTWGMWLIVNEIVFRQCRSCQSGRPMPSFNSKMYSNLHITILSSFYTGQYVGYRKSKTVSHIWQRAISFYAMSTKQQLCMILIYLCKSKVIKFWIVLE